MQGLRGDNCEGRSLYSPENRPQVNRQSGKNHLVALGEKRTVSAETKAWWPLCCLAEKRGYGMDRNPATGGGIIRSQYFFKYLLLTIK